MNTTRGVTDLPEERFVRSAPAARRTFYRSAGVSVTEHWFTTPTRRFAVAELHDVQLARGPYDPMVIATAVMALVVLVAVGTSMFKLEPTVWPAMIGVAMIGVTAAAVTWRLRPRAFELWAEYRGEWVQVFRCADEKTYGHVRRALIRARELGAGDASAGSRPVSAA